MAATDARRAVQLPHSQRRGPGRERAPERPSADASVFRGDPRCAGENGRQSRHAAEAAGSHHERVCRLPVSPLTRTNGSSPGGLSSLPRRSSQCVDDAHREPVASSDRGVHERPAGAVERIDDARRGCVSAGAQRPPRPRDSERGVSARHAAPSCGRDEPPARLDFYQQHHYPEYGRPGAALRVERQSLRRQRGV